MMGNTLQLGRLFGIELKLDYSWFIIFTLIAWFLAGHYFPMTHPGWVASIYWGLSVVTALLFLASALAHELAHSFVSQAFGVPVRDITLFLFGGAAQHTEEPKSARAELLMALAGPAASLILAGLFGALGWVSAPRSDFLHTSFVWLAWINLGLALFNLLPGFPLDGGRALRAVVWAITGSLQRATRVATRVGRFVALGFVYWGIWQIFVGTWADGVWIAFIGWFLLQAAAAADREVAVHQLLTDHTVREVMMTDCPHVLARLTLDVVVDHIVLPSGRGCFLVTADNRVQGLITLQQIKRVPRRRWKTTRVEEVVVPRDELKVVTLDDDLIVVFERMAAEGVYHFFVLDKADDRLLGILAREHVIEFLQMQSKGGSKLTANKGRI